MSEDIHTLRNELWARMRSKQSRENFVSAQISTGVAAQLLAMRESRGWTQKEVGERAEMSDARISVMENPNYDKITITTLKRLAAAFDVALMVRFIPFSQFVDWIAESTPDSLDATSFPDDKLAPRRKSVARRVQDVGGAPTGANKALQATLPIDEQSEFPGAPKSVVNRQFGYGRSPGLGPDLQRAS